jgi:hypothetical protein
MTQSNLSRMSLAFAATALIAGTATTAEAAEGGLTQYAPGASQFFAGSIPPVPGTYFLSQTSMLSSSRLNDANGDQIPLSFNLDAKVETLRLLHVTPLQFAGGDVWVQAVVPVVLDLGLDVGPFSGSSAGLGDVVIAGGLAWHQGPHTYVAGVDVALPTGKYASTAVANVGVNHGSVQPTLGYHYLDFANPTWEFAATMRYIVNFKNDDTDYTSGDEIVIDYAAGYHFGKTRLGVAGYYLKQLTDDKGPGVAPDGHRGKAFAIGPSVSYSVSRALNLSASYQVDVFAENRSKNNTLWLNLATKF